MSGVSVTFKVTFRVTGEQNLATVLQALAGAAVLESVLPCEAGPAAPPRKRLAYANGKRDKGISGPELVLEVLALYSAGAHLDTLASEFEARGFSPNSVSPAIAELRKAGKVEKVDQGIWRLSAAGKGGTK